MADGRAGQQVPIPWQYTFLTDLSEELKRLTDPLFRDVDVVTAASAVALYLVWINEVLPPGATDWRGLRNKLAHTDLSFLNREKCQAFLASISALLACNPTMASLIFIRALKPLNLLSSQSQRFLSI